MAQAAHKSQVHGAGVARKGGVLRIGSNGDSPINEYRVHHGQVEFRSTVPAAEQGSWRTLSGEELTLHENLNTAVAQWLRGGPR